MTRFRNPMRAGGVARPSRDGGPPFLETTWYWGCNNAQVNVYRSETYPLSDAAWAVGCNPVRVRRLEDGSVECWLYTDKVVQRVGPNSWRTGDNPEPRWERMLTPGTTGEALLARAEAEAAARSAHLQEVQ